MRGSSKRVHLSKKPATATVRNDHGSAVEQGWLCSVMCSLGFSGPAQSLSPAAVTALFWFLTVRGRALGQEGTDDGSDSEEELAAFCPKVMELLGEGKNKPHCGDMWHLAVSAQCS